MKSPTTGGVGKNIKIPTSARSGSVTSFHSSSTETERVLARRRHAIRRARVAARALSQGTARHRIPIVIGLLMFSVALFFDIFAGLGTKIFHLAGTFTSLMVTWIPWIGALLGGVIWLAAILVGETAGWVIMFFGYATIGLWFALRGVPLFGGSRMALRVGIFAASVIIEMTPFLNFAPGLTTWTCVTILLTRHEDSKNKDATLTAREVVGA